MCSAAALTNWRPFPARSRSASPRRGALGRRSQIIHQEGAVTLQRERDKLEPFARRLKRHGRACRHDLRDRHNNGRHASGSARSTFPVPDRRYQLGSQGSPSWCGNDDAGRAIRCIWRLVARAASVTGSSRAPGDSGIDIGRLGPAGFGVRNSGGQRRRGYQASPVPRGTSDNLKKLTAIGCAGEEVNDSASSITALAELDTIPRTNRRRGRPSEPRRWWVAQAKR